MHSISKQVQILQAHRREISARAFAWGRRRAPRLAGIAETGVDFSTGRVKRRLGRLETARGALEVAYIGHDEPYMEWLASAVSGACRTSQPGPTRRRSLAHATQGEVDITVIEVPAHLRQYFAGQGWLILPTVVNHIQPLTGSGEKANKHERKVRGKVRRSGLDVRFTRSWAELSSFYRTMHVPTVRGRYGQAAIIRHEGYFRLKLRKGWLILVEREGIDIAGMIVEPTPESPEILSLLVYGEREGNYGTTPNIVRLTPLVTAIDWARRSGFRSVQWGGTLPLLDHGLMRRKLRWGTRLEINPRCRFHLAVRLERDSPALRALLAAHPFVALSGAGPVGIRGDAAAETRSWPPGLGAHYVAPDDDPTAGETAFENGDRAAALRRLAIQLYTIPY